MRNFLFFIYKVFYDFLGFKGIWRKFFNFVLLNWTTLRICTLHKRAALVEVAGILFTVFFVVMAESLVVVVFVFGCLF